MNKLAYAGLLAVAFAASSLAQSTPTITTSPSLPHGVVNSPYTNSLAATGGVSPYSWSVVAGPGTGLPPGISLSSGGAFSGAPFVTGTYTFRIRVTDSQPSSATADFTLVIDPILTIDTASPLTSGNISVAYSQPLNASGGIAPYRNWTITAGSLPAGLSLNSASGIVSGTPVTAGSNSFTLQVQDSGQTPQTATKPFSLTINPGTLSIATPSPLPAGTGNTAYSQTLAATGGTPPYKNWSVISGSLPFGLSLNSSSGVVSGTPASSGAFAFTVQVTDSTAASPQSALKAFSLSIAPGPLTISTTSPLSNALAGSPYSYVLFATGGTSPYVNWTVTTGTLPNGLTLNAITGEISGTPTAPGSSTFSVSVKDSSGQQQTATKSLTLPVVSGPLTITSTSPLLAATQGSPYSLSLAAAGGNAPYTNWVVTSGALPAGLSLNAATGAITGTPTALGRSNFVVQAGDASVPRQFAAKALSLTVYSTTLAIQSNPLLPSGTVLQPYNYSFVVTGGAPPYSFFQGSGTLPPGLSLDSSGSLTGVPIEPGTYNFTVDVFDSAGGVGFAASKNVLAANRGALVSQSFTIHINNAAVAITPATLPDAVVNTSYSQQLTITNGPASDWFVASGALPGGVSLSSSGGLISGTPTQTGVFPFTVTATDQAGNVAVQPYELTVGSGQPTITTASPVPNGVINTPYSLTLATTGGQAPYVYSLDIVNSLPPGLNMTPAGVISGTPTQDGSFGFTVQVLDAAGRTDSKFFIMFVNLVAPLNITTGSPLPGGTLGSPYNQTFTAAGGFPPYSWSLSTGTLPPGLTFSSAGSLTGTPTQSGTFTFTLSVMDTSEESASKSFTVTIAIPGPPSITTATLPGGIVGAPYSQALAATSGLPPYTWGLSSGALPAGLTITSGGVIQGVPTTVGNYVLIARVTDSLGVNATRQLAIAVNNTFAITTASPLPDATTNTQYSQQLAATGGTGNYGWQLNSGALPTGLTLSSGGLISGVPTQGGSFTFTILATDLGVPAAVVQASKVFTLLVSEGGPVITTTALPAGQALVAYSFSLASSGGAPPYTYSLAEGALPSGFALTTGGQIIGTAGDALTSTFTVRVTDTARRSSTRQFTLSIAGRQSPGILPVEITTTGLPQGNVDRLYAFVFSARNGVAPYTWAISGLPAGLEANANGEIIGTPQRAGTSLVQVVVTDDIRGRATGTFNLVIKPPPVTIVTERAPDGRVDEAYSASFAATGGTAPYTFGLAGGSLPPGLAISAAGVASGTPSRAGSYQFTVQATDAAGEKGARGFTVIIRPTPLTITTASLGNGVVSFPFTAALAAAGGTPPYKWSASGLPDGVTVDNATGAISGTPSKPGSFTVSAQVTDQDNQNASRSYTVEIASQLSITTLTVGNMVVGTPVSSTLAASGGKPPYSWSVLGGSLPGGVTLNADGTISGTPTATGDANFTAQVRDANNSVASRAYSVRVVTALVLTTQTIPSAPFGAAYSTSFAATGGTPPYTWSIASGSLPSGLTFTSAGAITGSTTATGTFNFTVQVADSGTAPQTVQRAFTLTVQLPDISGLNVGVPQNPQPGQQGNITLSIGSPYPVDVTGTLTLTFAPNAANNADDPAIQFSSGGRTVQFTILAGQTQATFRVPSLGIQTGTTAGTITLATTLQAGGGPINCNCQLNQTIVVPRAAPVISSVKVTRTAAGFSVVVAGFSTTREVTQGTFRFAGTTNLQTTELNVALTATFNTYFQSAASSAFGGQFSLTIPFTIQGDTATVNSVTVVLANAVGSSQPVTATF